MGCFGSKEKQGDVSSEKKSSQVAETKTVEACYEISDELGRGAFSVVKRAKRKSDGQPFAIKFVDKKAVEPQDLMLLAREIDIMKKVSHPNVLKLVEIFDSTDTIALVMELITGGELFYRIVERGNYSEQDARAIVRQMLQGVSYLHSQGVAHRDLKPENLLCADDDPQLQPFRVVIADFGLSKAFDSGEKLETSCGTPDYVAPEVITAESSYDKSVDMWSCGVITYVLLCGYSPFASESQTGLFDKIIKAHYSFPDNEWRYVSDEAKDFIRHLLLKEPSKRLTAAQCLEHAWLTSDGVGASSSQSLTGEFGSALRKYNEARKKPANAI
eukprot:TRINITY_DN657_c0_g2_i1.p1 TRINITY_DN657_c0_g2~~TRINITY_DN657_c0_g2_i1.p1  ORF type:complete len:329 (-),score=88.56 TRINITY_DN657_c0_g2_i1:287-1273(-)